ncbi:MAG: response regulator [Rhodocyclaceae bacterium]|nr:response regulator [Rhodocyclaceae bacterium]
MDSITDTATGAQNPQRRAPAQVAAPAALDGGVGGWLRKNAILLGGSLILLSLSAAAAFMIWLSRIDAIEDWRTNLSSVSTLLAQHAEQTLTAADAVLGRIADHVEASGADSVEDLRRVMGTRAAHQMMLDRIRGASQIDVATIVDRNGDVINFTRSYPPPHINLADREYFMAHMADPKLELFLSVPVQNRGNGRWTFYLARKIVGPTGNTLGLVLAGVESAYFQKYYKDVLPDPEFSAISLFRRDGTLMARVPERADSIGKRSSALTSLRIIESGMQAGTIVTDAPRPLDPARSELRIVAPHLLENYPLYVNLTAAEGLVLRRWRTTAKLIGAGVLVLDLLILASTIWLHRLRRRRDIQHAQLQRAHAAAQAASRAKSEFVANMSHEIRTPLNGMMGLTRLVLDGEVVSPEERNEYLRAAYGCAENLCTLLNDVLDFARMESGQVELRDEPFALAACVADTLNMLVVEARAKQLALELEFEGGVPRWVRGDAARLRQILLILVGNAIKFTERGSVNVRLNCLQPPLGGHGPTTLQFLVRDTGIGISPDKIPIVFDAFAQGDSSLTRRHGGRGLGLALSRRLVGSMGGEIDVVSTPGEGSCFRFSLRLEVPHAPEAQLRALQGKASLRVLLAEGDVPARIHLVELLQALGHEVATVSDGPAAILSTATALPELAIFSGSLARSDGFSVAAELRALGLQLPILATADADDAQFRAAVAKAGMNGALTKDCSLLALAEQIHLCRPYLQSTTP